MTQRSNWSLEQTLLANKEVHKALVESGDYQKSPHFLDENMKRVKSIIRGKILPTLKNNLHKAIDFGCGTGFIIDLIKDNFDEVVGIDITPEMLEKVDVGSGNIVLKVCEAENIPFDSNTFDLATAYSFMDHLHDVERFLLEAHRVLRPGGVFYSDLNPNKDFSELINATFTNYPQKAENNLILNHENISMHYNGKYYEEKFNIESSLLDRAEPVKSTYGGFDTIEFRKLAFKVGFSDVKIEHDWFLGQASYVLNSPELNTLKEYMCKIYPASVPFYKYIRFICQK